MACLWEAAGDPDSQRAHALTGAVLTSELISGSAPELPSPVVQQAPEQAPELFSELSTELSAPPVLEQAAEQASELASELAPPLVAQEAAEQASELAAGFVLVQVLGCPQLLS